MSTSLAKCGRWAGLVPAVFCLVLGLATARPGQAHNTGESYLYLQIFEDSVTGRFEIALSDLNPALGLTGTDQEITPETFDQRVDFLKDYYREKVQIIGPEGPVRIRFTGHRLLTSHGGFALLPFEMRGLTGVPETLTFDYSVLLDEEPSHRGFLLVEHNWATGTFANENQISLTFGPSSRRHDFSLTKPNRMRGFLTVVRLGIDRIWGGIDHLLFLIALLIPAVLRREDGKWQPVPRLGPALIHLVKILAAFTVAHSVTLVLAALDIVSLPKNLVEIGIAVSIAAVALHLLFPILGDRLWMIVAVFGLFHGFGLAEALPKMGILREHLGLSLFGFNLGVEIGQVLIVAILVPILFLVRKLTAYRKVLVPAAAVFMILVACAWIIERTFDVDLPIRELAGPLEPWIP